MFAEDLTTYFSLDTPGSRAAVFAGNDIVVLFDNAYLDALGVSSRNPLVLARDIDVPGIAAGSAIAVDGVPYLVADVQPDGHGVTAMQLEAA